MEAISRNGPFSPSLESAPRLSVGGGGTGLPSPRFDKNPVANLPDPDLLASELGTGIEGSGLLSIAAGNVGAAGSSSVLSSTSELSTCLGVTSNSTRAPPSSASSRHLTARFLLGDFFLGVAPKATPFLDPLTLTRRLGDANVLGLELPGKAAEDISAAMCEGTAEPTKDGRDLCLSGLGPISGTCFRFLGVPCRVGGTASVICRPPSGLITCPVASVQLCNLSLIHISEPTRPY